MAILSIQSHVVYGAVGNTAAVFPLQRLGNEVWAVNTVEFSNHPGYGMYKGRIFDASLIDDLISALDERDVLNNCSAVLSGYLGAPDIAMSIFKAVKKVKAANPSALFACDPVMGDTGKGFYVHKDIPAMFKTHLIPHSDIITPNQFELNVLTNNIDTSTIENAVKAINILHAMGPKIVLVTSYEYKNSDKDNVNMLVSDTKNIFMITTPRLALSEKLCGGG